MGPCKRGWSCDNYRRRGISSRRAGRFRWFCEECESDRCLEREDDRRPQTEEVPDMGVDGAVVGEPLYSEALGDEVGRPGRDEGAARAPERGSAGRSPKPGIGKIRVMFP